jgi:6-phosphogluconolactonase (cycloisomerase 2 family)
MEVKMSTKLVFAVTVFFVLGLTGCSTSGCPTTGTPGTIGGTSGPTSGQVQANNCPSLASPGFHSTLLYSLNANGTDLIGARQDSSGSLTLLSFASPILPINDSEAMVIVRKQFLYVPMGDTTIRAFRIDRSTGGLFAISQSPYTVPTTDGNATTIVSDPLGRFLFVGSKNTGEVWAYQIDSKSGVLTLIAGSPFTFKLGFFAAASLAVNDTGKFLYVGQGDPALGVMAFSIDQITGALNPLAGTPFQLGVAHVHADPTASFLMGTAQIASQASPAVPEASIHVFSIASNGIPTPVAGSPFKTTSVPHDFMIASNGKFIFTFGSNTDTHKQEAIEGFQVNTDTGVLSMMSGSPFKNLPSVYMCVLGQSSNDAFCLDAFSGTKLSVLSIDSMTGAITHTGTDLLLNTRLPFVVTE